MAAFVALVGLDGLTYRFNPANVGLLGVVPAYAGGPGTYIQNETGDRVAVAGTPAANALLLAAAGTAVFVSFTGLDGTNYQVNPALTESLSDVPASVGGPGCYIGIIGGTDRIAVTGTTAAAAAALSAAIVPVITTSVPVANTLFVMVGGSDVTGERGNLVRPFATLTGAMAAAQINDTIIIGPGIFAEPDTVELPTLGGVTIVGSGPGTALTFPNVPATPGFLVPPGGVGSLTTVRDLSVTVQGNNIACWVNPLGTSSFVGLAFRNVAFNAAIGGQSFQAFGARDLLLEGCTFNRELSLVGCTGIVRGCDVNLCGISRQATDAFDAGDGYVRVDGGTRIEALALTDSAQIHATEDSQVATAISASALGVFGGIGPHIILECTLGDPTSVGGLGDMDFTGLPTSVASMYIRIRVTGIGAGATWQFGQPNPLPATDINANGCRPYPGTIITITGDCQVRMRQVSTEVLNFTPSTTPLDRDMVVAIGIPLNPAPALVTINPPAFSSDYAVTISTDDAATAADTFVTGKGSSDYQLSSAAAMGAELADAVATWGV